MDKNEDSLSLSLWKSDEESSTPHAMYKYWSHVIECLLLLSPSTCPLSATCSIRKACILCSSILVFFYSCILLALPLSSSNTEMKKFVSKMIRVMGKRIYQLPLFSYEDVFLSFTCRTISLCYGCSISPLSLSLSTCCLQIRFAFYSCRSNFIVTFLLLIEEKQFFRRTLFWSLSS